MMAQPPIGTVAQEIYDGIAPLAFDDEANDWVLAYYCEAIGRQIELVAELALTDIDGEDGWSLLLDLDRCPSDSLAYLAQFNGTTLKAGLSDADQRARIAAAAGFARGTRAALIEAVRVTLTGGQDVHVRERYNEADPGPDYAYYLQVRTLASETPDPAASLAASISQKPAGIILQYSDVTGEDYQDLFDLGYDYQDVIDNLPIYQDVLVG